MTTMMTAAAAGAAGMMTTKGKLEVYGKGAYVPPAPVVQGPSAEQVEAARGLIDDAKDSLEELQERIEDSDEDCTTRLIGRLGSLEDAIGDARQSTRRGEVDAALQRAFDAQKVLLGKCSKKSAKKWSRSMDRVVARLQGASKYL